MKKITTLFLILLSSVYFSGCSKKDKNVSTETLTSLSESTAQEESLNSESTEESSSSEISSSVTESQSESSTEVTESSSEESSPNETNEELDPYWTYSGSYYDNISLASEGTDLLTTLRSLNTSKQKKSVGYANFKTGYLKTDVDPENPSNLICFYSGTSAVWPGDFSTTINREHVWPKSRGGNLVEGDIHMTRPTLKAENSDRGNSFYVEGMNSTSEGWDPANCSNAKYRGIAARIIFYCVVANSQLSLVDKNYDSSNSKTMGKLSDLMKWNLMYPVDETELLRNNEAEKLQGNRNPFIDNPYLAVEIWKDTNSAISEICDTYKDTLTEKEESASIETNESRNFLLIKINLVLFNITKKEIFC